MLTPRTWNKTLRGPKPRKSTITTTKQLLAFVRRNRTARLAVLLMRHHKKTLGGFRVEVRPPKRVRAAPKAVAPKKKSKYPGCLPAVTDIY